VISDREVDITDINQVRAFIGQRHPAWIINAAAYTAVDQAEKETESAFAINGLGPGVLGAVAAQTGATIVHFSTDYVFDGSGDRPWVETDSTGPLSVYGRSKLDGERRLAEATDRYFTFRISWLYGVRGKNFVKTMVRLFREKPELRVISDQIGGPTWARGLARNIAALVTNGKGNPGIYHYSDAGYISWFDFAVGIRDAALAVGAIDREISILPIPTSEYSLPAPRPANSRFSHDKVRNQLGFNVLPWRSNLDAFFREWKALDFRP